MRRSALAVALLAACGPSGDPLNIHYTFSSGPEQACIDQARNPVRDCNDVAMTCDSVALLRIVDPEDANHIYLEQCGSIPNNHFPQNLCPITQAITPNGSFPTSRVEIQLAVYPRWELPLDVNLNPICPSHVEFTASQFAVPTNDPQPALAGVAYSDGFDSEVTIVLGCNDTGLIDTVECRDQNALDVGASVLDFDQQFSVSTALASQLLVRVGAPTREDTHWTFASSTTFEMDLQATTQPSWRADNLNIDNLENYLCLQVLEDGRATPAMICEPVTAPVPNTFDLIGMRVEQSTLDDVLDAVGVGMFPTSGLLIGMVVNGGDPVAGAAVFDGAGSNIQYLAADRMSFVPGGTMTTSTGIFVSDNAPLELDGNANHWGATAEMQTQRNDPIGGLIDNRLMVVVIQLDPSF